MKNVYCIFGATGNLAQLKIIPALFDIYNENKDISIFCFGRTDILSDDFRDISFKNNNKYTKSFLEKLVYLKIDQSKPEDFKNIEKELKDIYSNIIFYLSLPPSEYLNIIKSLSHLNIKSKFYILVEKPFADSLESLFEIEKISKNSNKTEILFVDHYLFKNFINEILDYKKDFNFRDFVGSLLSVEVKFLESNTLAKRGLFYDKTGAIFDVGQNHILQMINTVFVESPFNFKPEERLKVLNNLYLSDKGFARGQYKNFRKEDGVSVDSETETYFKAGFDFKCIDLSIPVFVEAGKSCKDVFVGVILNFKNGSVVKIGSSSENAYIKILKMEDHSRFVCLNEAILSFKIAKNLKERILKEKMIFYILEDGLC